MHFTIPNDIILDSENKECFSVLLFSICKVTESTQDRFFASDPQTLTYLGILGKWWNIPFTFQEIWPIYHTSVHCNSRGIYIGNDRCICLPSWQGNNCDSSYNHFSSIIGKSLGWLDILLFTYIIIYVLWCFFDTCQWMHNIMKCSWWNVVTNRRALTLVTASLSHPNLALLIINITQLYQIGPWIASRLANYDSKSSTLSPLLFFIGAALFINLCTIIFHKSRGYSLKQTYGSSCIWISAACLKIFMNDHHRHTGYISYNGIINLAKLWAGQSLAEICFLGETNIVGHLSGCIYAIFIGSFNSSNQLW